MSKNLSERLLRTCGEVSGAKDQGRFRNGESNIQRGNDVW